MGWLSSLFGNKGTAQNTAAAVALLDPQRPFFDPDGVPHFVHKRLADSKSGALPWVSTLTAPEMALARSHGLKMLAPIAATCWMHYGFSWTEGHAHGWRAALDRLRAEAQALGANAVVDVKMVTVDLSLEDSMDYSLVGTAVRVEGLPASSAPIISTVPALEFIQLLDAGIVPVGLAVGARFDWSSGVLDAGKRVGWRNNQPLTQTTAFWERVRRSAHADLRKDAARQGTGVLAQLQFSQIFMVEDPEPGRMLGRHIVMGTVVDVDPEPWRDVDHKIDFVLDLSDDTDKLRTTSVHHNSYNDGI